MAVAQIGTLNTFSPGTVISSSDVNSNFADIKTAFNNLVSGTNEINIDTLVEVTTDAGILVDGVKCKDGAVDRVGADLVLKRDGVTGITLAASQNQLAHKTRLPNAAYLQIRNNADDADLDILKAYTDDDLIIQVPSGKQLYMCEGGEDRTGPSRDYMGWWDAAGLNFHNNIGIWWENDAQDAMHEILKVNGSNQTLLDSFTGGAILLRVNYNEIARIDANVFKLSKQGYVARVDNGDESGTTVINWNTGNVHRFRMTAAVTTLTLQNPVAGATYILEIDRTGDYDVTWPGAFLWGDAGAPTQATVSGEIDVVSLYWNGTNYLAVLGGAAF